MEWTRLILVHCFKKYVQMQWNRTRSLCSSPRTLRLIIRWMNWCWIDGWIWISISLKFLIGTKFSHKLTQWIRSQSNLFVESFSNGYVDVSWYLLRWWRYKWLIFFVYLYGKNLVDIFVCKYNCMWFMVKIQWVWNWIETQNWNCSTSGRKKRQKALPLPSSRWKQSVVGALYIYQRRYIISITWIAETVVCSRHKEIYRESYKNEEVASSVRANNTIPVSNYSLSEF